MDNEQEYFYALISPDLELCRFKTKNDRDAFVDFWKFCAMSFDSNPLQLTLSKKAVWEANKVCPSEVEHEYIRVQITL